CDQDQVLTSGKTASAGPTGPCESMTLTNTYNFMDNAALDDVSLSELILTENNDNLMEYVGPAQVWFDGAEIFCFTVSDSTPAGPLEISFVGCLPAETVRNKELIVSYDMVVTDQSQPLPPCDNSHTFYSWTDLDLGPDTPTGECLGLTGVHETVPITVDPPSMRVTMSSLPGLVENCGEYPVTITVDQLSAIEPYDVRVVLENANYYAISYDGCGGDVNPTNCGAPADIGSGVQWNYDDLFVGGATSATIDITVKKRCGDSPDLIARVYYDDLCHDDAAYNNTCDDSDT
ncbi:MAG: hypothetical protein GY842_05130, partial [bacterium]|nr:hypothetical protein [bacterium]